MGEWSLAKVAGLGVLLSLALLSSVSQAFPVQLEVVGKVPVGKAPELILIGTEQAKNASISLTRDDGKKFSYRVGDLAPGQTRRIRLDSRPGHHVYRGTMSAEIDGEKDASPVEFSTIVAKPLQLKVDRNSVDLESRRLALTASRPIAQIDIKVIGLNGSILSTKSIRPASPSAKALVSWDDPLDQDLVRIELRVEDKNGFFSAVALTPWSITIPHEEVLFERNSAKIDSSEHGKLRSSLQKVREALTRFRQIKGVKLFIAGHTDSRGSPAHNARLSRRRARAIAAWFATNKLPLRISYEGFGESSQKVKTPDETDEPKNRRVDYILSVEPPPLRSGTHHWRQLN